MKSVMTVILGGLCLTVFCAAALSASRRPPGLAYYHFDGQGFIAGKPAGGGVFIAVGSHRGPEIRSGTERAEAVALPPGKGAVAGICYIQNSGGKLAHASGYTPCRRVPVRISSEAQDSAAVLTDEEGYFVAVLAAGVYRIGDAPLGVEVRVEDGQTTLVPLRAGKRMVD